MLLRRGGLEEAEEGKEVGLGGLEEEEVVEGGRGHEVVMARVCLVVMGGREEGGGGVDGRCCANL